MDGNKRLMTLSITTIPVQNLSVFRNVSTEFAQRRILVLVGSAGKCTASISDILIIVLISYREGQDCNTCIPLGGCIHGGCNEPFECDCNLAKDQNKRGKYVGAHCDSRKKEPTTFSMYF